MLAGAVAQRPDDEDEAEEAAGRHREIAAAQIVRRRRGEAAEDGEALAGDVPRRWPDGDEAGEEEDEEDEEALEARRAAVRERCALHCSVMRAMSCSSPTSLVIAGMKVVGAWLGRTARAALLPAGAEDEQENSGPNCHGSLVGVDAPGGFNTCFAHEQGMPACRLRKKAAEAEAELPAEPDEEDDEEEEEESEYETDSEDEGFGRALLKPVFVPKAWLRAAMPGCLPVLTHASAIPSLRQRVQSVCGPPFCACAERSGC